MDPVDLNVNTTIGGNTDKQHVTDMDTLNALGCQDGEIAKCCSAYGHVRSMTTRS